MTVSKIVRVWPCWIAGG